MAAELIEGLDPALTEASGLIIRKSSEDGCELLSVEVTDENGAALIGKSIGSYHTLTLPQPLSVTWRDCVSALTAVLRRLLPPLTGCTLVAALGNPNVTPDALGPLAAESILVTHHLPRTLPELPPLGDVALCRTGVLGTSGVESAEHIRALVSLLRPSLVIAVDALACRELEGLCRSVQVSSSGIAPGSGVGNDRARLDSELLGVPVISVGVPTVADLSPDSPLFVTPRDIDAQVRLTAKLIAYALDLALHPALDISSLEELL